MAERVRFVYTGIRVRDLDRSLRFYERLGFREVKRDTFPHGGTYVHLCFPGSPHRLELNFYPRGSRYYTPFRAAGEFDHFGFYAPDPSGWLRSVVRAGAKKRLDYSDDIQRILFVTDPDGVWLGAFGPKPIRGIRRVRNPSGRVPRPRGRTPARAR